MKKKTLFIALAGVIVLGISIVGGTMAARNASTKNDSMTSEGVITTNSLEIDLKQDNPNQTINLNSPVEVTYTISNAESDDSDVYDRFARLVIEKDFGFDTSAIEVMPIGENAADWVVVDPYKNYSKISNKYESLSGITEDENLKKVYMELAEYYKLVASNTTALNDMSEDYIYIYYKNMLGKNDSAVCHLQVVFTGSSNATYSTDSQITINATADAVQAIAAEKAIPSEWGMFVELSEDGNQILKISETPDFYEVKADSSDTTQSISDEQTPVTDTVSTSD